MELKVYDMEGKEAGTIELKDDIFGVDVNLALLHEAVKNYLANQRQGTSSTLTRSMVRGGGRKPFPQKGRGSARQGSRRAPQWVHGGIVFGPQPRSYRYSMNKKAKRQAFKSAFSAKVAEGNMIVLDTLKFDEIKTKQMVKVLNALNVEGKALVVIEGPDKNVVQSAKNLPNVKTLYVNTLNIYDIINYDKFIVTKSAVEKMEEVYN
jgi:large subunit ribosomal protein L4